MPAIRRRYNLGRFVLAPHVISNSRPIVGQSVDVVLSDQSLSVVHFIGFVELPRAKKLPGNWVEITNVVGFNQQADLFGSWTDINQRECLLGRFIPAENGVYLVLEDDAVIKVRSRDNDT